MRCLTALQTCLALLLAFFRGILEPRYSLADAVRDRVLTPYFYRPHIVHLAEDEAHEWQTFTSEIKRLQARLRARNDAHAGLSERLQHLLLQRARIVKHARAKVPLSVEVLTSEYERGQRWIVYCEDRAQLQSVSNALAARVEAKLGISLGNTTADGRVTLEPIYCLGLCATAPSAMLDARVVGRLDQARIDALVAEAQR